MTNANEAEAAMLLAQSYFAQAQSYMARGQTEMQRYFDLLPGGKGVGTVGANRNGPKCLRVWAEYLKENGPSLRQEIQDETGVRFTERATPYTVMWEDEMVTYGDDHFAQDTIVRMRSVRNADGRAGTQTAYFLWSQRFDVFGRFGVGPQPAMAQVLLGVVHPPTEQPTVLSAQSDGIHPINDGTYKRRSEPEPTVPEYERFATMEQWHERWDPIFDELAPYDATPTDEEKAAMRATLPEDTGGEPWTVVLARSYQEAKVRSKA
jgi:hypothetical protein